MHDAAVAFCGDGDCQRDELARFFAKFGGGGSGGAQCLVTLDRVGRDFHQFADARAKLLVVLIPIDHHRKFSVRRMCRADTSTRLARKLQDFVARRDGRIDGTANFSWHKRCDIFSSSVARIAPVLASETTTSAATAAATKFVLVPRETTYMKSVYNGLTVPAEGRTIGYANGELQVPDSPVIPFIEGDGTGRDIWKASRRVFDAAVEHAYGGKRKVVWFEVFAGEKAFNTFKEWLPNDSVEAIRDFRVAIKGPLTTPVGGGIRSLNVALRQIVDLSSIARPVRYVEGVRSPVEHQEKWDASIFW